MSQKHKPDPLLVRAGEAARRWGIPKSILIQAVKDGKIRGGQASKGPTSPYLLHAEDVKQFAQSVMFNGRKQLDL